MINTTISNEQLEPFSFEDSKDNIVLQEINKYPVEILYSPRKTNIQNVLVFYDERSLVLFLKKREYLRENLGGRGDKLGKIQLWGWE